VKSLICSWLPQVGFRSAPWLIPARASGRQVTGAAAVDPCSARPWQVERDPSERNHRAGDTGDSVWRRRKSITVRRRGVARLSPDGVVEGISGMALPGGVAPSRSEQLVEVPRAERLDEVGVRAAGEGGPLRCRVLVE
jgi:hypothetical protein